LPSYRAPPDDRTKGLLRILVADKFTHGQINELIDLFQVNPALVSASNKSDRAGALIRRLQSEHLKELVATVFGDGFVQPSMTSEGCMKAEAALRAACIMEGPADPPWIAAPSSGFAHGDIAQPVTLPDEDPFAVAEPVTLPATPPWLNVTPTTSPTPVGKPAVFVVHGHDVAARESVARLIERLGFEAIVLGEQADAGRTIIEKFEAHAARVVFAVVMLTADDVGASKAMRHDLRPRARQNVFLELGYFAAKLDRAKVCAIHEADVEIPSDFAGVLYVQMDPAGAWKLKVAREMKAAGLMVDLNLLHV